MGKRSKEHGSIRKLPTYRLSDTMIKFTNHQFYPEQVEILAKVTKDFSRRVLEAIIHINQAVGAVH